ncbi:hypothetical protein TI01_1093 [Lysobacter sp. A03]|nr:hypothetical protein TI01_1093 [Lysobacter sp. A03]
MALVLVAALACSSLLATPQAAAATQGKAEFSGVVYADTNENGRRDPDEPGVSGVKLSNGRDIVLTDADGSYRIPVRPGDTVFAVKPADRAFATGADGLPAFWQHYFPAGSPALEYGGIPADNRLSMDVALHAGEPLAGDLEVLLMADPQVKSLVDVDYYDRDILDSIRKDAPAQLGLSLGDIVDDDLSLYPAINARTAALGVPWLHAPGNHDMDLDAASDAESTLTFRRYFGPDTVAWEEQGTAIVLLDDVIHLPGDGYVGGLREDQFAFLESYLPTLADDTRLVVGAHIPFFNTATAPGAETFRVADRQRLFQLLQRFDNVLLLSGHTHVQQHFHHGAAEGWNGRHPLHEYNVGAACGAFWSGVKDEAGIPDATMADGTPNGYARLKIGRSGDYALSWHPARLPANHAEITNAMALHAPRVLRRGAYPAWGVYANVFMGMDDSKVEYRIDGGEWKPMRKVVQADPRLLAENVRDDEADMLRGFDRSPEAKPSRHLWRGALPTDLAAGEHNVEVRTTDRWIGEQAARTTYRLQDGSE